MNRGPLKRSTRPIPRRRSKPRRGPSSANPSDFRNPDYRAWLRSKPCAVCASLKLKQRGKSDAAHTERNGMSSKGPDSSCVPLCRFHHREYDAGRKQFEAKYSIDINKLAAAHFTNFQGVA